MPRAKSPTATPLSPICRCPKPPSSSRRPAEGPAGSENETFDTLKTKGYNLEHNFGHGAQHLAATLATLNLLAFAMHTVSDLVDNAWAAARKAVGSRKRFFEDLRALTTYLVFPTWDSLVETLRSGVPPPLVRDG